MPFTTSVPRDQAGSLVLPAPPRKSRATAQDNAKTEVLECGGNTQLMEARLCQMTCSMRALIRSNQELEDALKVSPGDVDFLQAIAENQLTIRRQGQVAVALVQEMQARGCHVELEEDIRQIILGSGEITAVVFGAESSSSATESNATSSNDNQNSNNDATETGSGGGVFL
jgi:hypothetical protein